ncbi:GIY-YIG nuclease family protein [Phenylobacterium hankyongense]|uniref:GIY-YIG nuclease family protein n=1 Tax=Phenylobacterium hankyongense TaxID=1813876 RepID=A0A328B2E3_9CAUL|nr:GIY-YIG nuclease family protein [Phenylobacterium hankyongense]RAK60611.1 GIY-YIG nuclease family protein [Phenylobacterium hankyongense]
MDKSSRRAAIRDYKERKAQAGIFAVRCLATGEVWVAVSRNLGQQQNSVWFGLRGGGYPNRAAQALWNAHGEAAFSFEVVEAIEDEDLSAYARDNRLKEALRRGLERLGAKKLVG